MKIEYVSDNLCIIFENSMEEMIRIWSVENNLGNVFVMKDEKSFEVDCFDADLCDHIKICWSAWCIDKGLT